MLHGALASDRVPKLAAGIQFELCQIADKYARRAAHCKSALTSGIHRYTTEVL